MSLTSRIIKTEMISWKDLKFIQQEDFKDWPSEAKEKLKASILANQFTQPFYVWQDREDNFLYCLDGKHRTMILEELIAEGQNIPDLLPGTFIECDNKQEAAKLVLIYSSVYARITEQGLTDFLKIYDLDLEKIKMETSIFGLTDLPELSIPLPESFIGDPKNKPAVIKITFENTEDLEEMKPLIENLIHQSKKEFILSVSAGEI